MVKIYDEEIIPGYKQTFKDVVYNTSEETLNEYLVDFTSEKAKIGDNILQKYQVLSKEYQSQAKSFKEKHEEIKAGEVQKRDQIISNFENHYKTIQE
jgi:K+/H+ antiporter YhaU regulatory subunit KhtT